MEHNSNITSNETWYLTDSPHIITADISISATLTIEAGCVVKFDQGCRLTITTGGKLIAQGTVDNWITFKKNDGEPSWNDRIIFVTNQSGNVIKYCKFEGSGASCICLDICCSGSYFTIDHLLFTGDGSADGIQFRHSSTLNIEYITADDLGYAIITAVGSAVLNVKNSIVVNSGKGLYQYSGTINSTYNDVWNNTTDYDGCSAGTSDISQDPEFVGGSPYDYNLQSSSPCVAAGEGGTYMGCYGAIVIDIDNDFRMVGTFTTADIDNDFRLIGAVLEDINNDFRIAGDWVKIDIANEFRIRLEVLKNIANKFNTCKEILKEINNKFAMVREIKNDIYNDFRSKLQKLHDITNDFRTCRNDKFDINNDFRMITQWQIPGEEAFESLGKSYIKIYINDIEQTDVDIDSVSWTEVLNSSATARFNLGRAFDASKPSMKDVVKIKFNDFLMYKGYIIEINPTENPESIQIICQDEYWNLNKTKKYFLVGRKPADTKEYYYTKIKDALSSLGFGYGIGDFIPQPMDLYGRGVSDCISELVQNAGNFGWFIRPDGSKRLWQVGKGSIVDIEPQKIGTNLGLFQAIRHNFRESISDLVNKFRVRMGNWTIRKVTNIGDGSGRKFYTRTMEEHYRTWLKPIWTSSREILGKNAPSGYGYDWPPPGQEYKYEGVFRKFYIEGINRDVGALSDRYPPVITVYSNSGFGAKRVIAAYNKGFTINWEGEWIEPEPFYTWGPSGPQVTVTFASPLYDDTLNDIGEVVNLYASSVRIDICKERRSTYTPTKQTDPNTEPAEDEDYPYMFYTDKMGNYPETITEDLNLANLSIQEGYTYFPPNYPTNPAETIPTWDDREFAKDYANWQLSKKCDIKTTGSIDLTIDAMLYYGIDLSKRIKVDGIVDAININSITYNVRDFTATIQLESGREYKRTISISYHGE